MLGWFSKRSRGSPATSTDTPPATPAEPVMREIPSTAASAASSPSPPPARPQVPPGSAPPTHDVLVAQLRNVDDDVRVAAARELGRRGNRLAVPALIATLRDPHPRVRIAAAHALGKLRDERAVEALGGAMSDDADDNVQAAARGALEAIGTSGADAVLAEHDARREQTERDAHALANPTLDRTRGVEGLLAALRGPHERLQTEAADALAEAGPAAVEPLAAMLTGESIWIRKRVAELLGRIGDARAAQPLRAALDAVPLEDRSYETYQFRDAARRALAAVTVVSPSPTTPAPPEPPLDFDERSRVAASQVETAPDAQDAPPSATPQTEDVITATPAPSDAELAPWSDEELGQRLLEIARAALGGGRPPLDSYDARRAAARSIGEELHRRGGIAKMQATLDTYVANLPGRHPIDQAWDGVGDWMG